MWWVLLDIVILEFTTPRKFTLTIKVSLAVICHIFRMLWTAGIPESDKQNDLEDKVLRTLKKLGCNIASNILEAFNCVGRYKEVFIKCSKRKDDQ